MEDGGFPNESENDLEIEHQCEFTHILELSGHCVAELPDHEQRAWGEEHAYHKGSGDCDLSLRVDSLFEAEENSSHQSSSQRDIKDNGEHAHVFEIVVVFEVMVVIMVIDFIYLDLHVGVWVFFVELGVDFQLIQWFHTRYIKSTEDRGQEHQKDACNCVLFSTGVGAEERRTREDNDASEGNAEA